MLQPGDTLNHGAYLIERKLGKGGFGLVYLGTEVALHRLVAIKRLQREWAEQEPGITEAFAAEARRTARLTHPHIVPIYFVGEEAGVRYLVMEFLLGGVPGRPGWPGAYGVHVWRRPRRWRRRNFTTRVSCFQQVSWQRQVGTLVAVRQRDRRGPAESSGGGGRGRAGA